jgi:CheY-like chemotaxis protein
MREPETNARNMNQPRVLLVDDDRSVLDALGAVLESEGFDVIRAANGHEAVEKFCEHRADLVLLDLNMPVEGGWDTYKRLKSINPLLPIVVITALMQKPLDIPLLLEAMRALLAEPAQQRLARITTHQPQTHYLA